MRALASLIMTLALVAAPAGSEIFEITYEVTFDDFSPPIVFGASAPTFVSTRFLLDTEAAPVVVIPAGTGDWPVDLFGYDISALSEVSVTFGTKTWDGSHVASTTPEAGFDAHVWFDEALANGATPETWFVLSDALERIIFGGAGCAPCVLVDLASVTEDSSDFTFGTSLDVSVRLLCGDGIVDANETCDDGNTVSGDGCSDLCSAEPPRCGDGNIDPGEECDDGNTADDDGCDNVCQIRLAGTCPTAPIIDCVVAERGSVKLSEKKVGGEKLSATLKKFDTPTLQSDFGDPVAGSTEWATCLYDGEGTLALQLQVDRAGEACGTKACWKTKSTKGFTYKDSGAASDGVRKITATSGPSGKGKLAIQAGNKAKKNQASLPIGTTEALEDSTSATLQVIASGGLCFEASLGAVKRADRLQFQAKTE